MTTTISPSRILLIRPSALGDVCRTVPVAASLRRAFSDARIDWIVQEEFRAAVEAHPAVNEAIGFPRRALAGWWRRPATALDAWRWLRSIRARQYDLVIDCQGLSRSGVIAWASGAPVRLGHRHAREFAWLAYTRRHAPADRARRHTVDEMLALLEAIGVEPVADLRLYATAEGARWWRAERAALSMSRARYAVLAPTSRWISKRWPIERWRELVAPLLRRGFERIVLLAAPNERDQLAGLVPEAADDDPDLPIINLAGRTDIAQTMAVIASADLVIANDSAPLHMAVGFDRPCVGLFGPTDPAIVGPYGRPASALRLFTPRPGEVVNYRDAKLGDRLMRVISTTAVLQRVDDVLSRAGDEPGHVESGDGEGKGEGERGGEGDDAAGATVPPPSRGAALP